jgi:hypothetical protein
MTGYIRNGEGDVTSPRQYIRFQLDVDGIYVPTAFM